ncbi:small ribosomal subunit protein bS1m-like [Liolophura sinensis]|uniref:small ribosomal subunit protein bS1m-like n=1 Tax=Liolophura sinensis TaxID=3198878 RepID=UPI00315908C8
MSAIMYSTRIAAFRNLVLHPRCFLKLSTSTTSDSTGPIASKGDSDNASNNARRTSDPGKQDQILNSNDTGSNNNIASVNTSSSAGDLHLGSTPEQSSYMRAFEKIDKMGRDDATEDTQSFASLIRNCKLTQIGNPDGRIVLGTVIDVVEDDLYVDFGGKFHCVCARPKHRASEYTYGTRVKLKLKDLEMTSAFLGSDKHVTLLEADGSIIGIHRSSQWAKTDIK